MNVSRSCRVLSPVVLGLGLALGCGGGKKGDLQVMSYAPQGPVDKAEAVEIRFDKPVVGEALVGKPADATMVTIRPAVAWKGYWQDRQTLVVEPTEPLAASTRYQVTLAGELGTRTAGFGFAFVHRPLAVEGVWGVDPNLLAPDGELPLSFNQPVSAADAAAHCKLVGDLGTIALGSPFGSTEASANLALKPVTPLAPGAAYTITCAGLAGVGGNATLDKPYTLAVRARPPLGVTRIGPDGHDVPADEVTLTFAFTTPVSLEAARKAVSSTPAIAGLDQGYLSGDGTEYKVTADLDTETDYRLAISKDLVDAFGQQLGKRIEHAFRTGDARPRLSMERGIFALEASARGYPLWSRNVGSFELACAAVPRDKLVQILTTDMNYDPWGGNADDRPIDWKALKLTAKTQATTTHGKNKWLLHELRSARRARARRARAACTSPRSARATSSPIRSAAGTTRGATASSPTSPTSAC